MDCNRVFALLTAAPFPTGLASDAEVSQHLASCPGCHRFAEALRPVSADAPETLPAGERRRLPQYRPTATPAAVGTGQRERTVGGFLGQIPAPYEGRSNRFSAYTATRPVAAFTLASAPHRSAWWDAVSLAGLMSAVAIGGWAFGVLAM